MPDNGDAQWLATVLSGAVSFACVLHIWLRRSGSLWRKAFWTFAVWLPVLGPIFYAAFYRIPRKSPDSEVPDTGYQY